MQPIFDVVVVGAGLAGLTCAQQLHQLGYRTVVVEKSRGLGGRLATRRVQTTWADHGVRYLESSGHPDGDLLNMLIATLHDRQLIQDWTDTVHELSPDGIVRASAAVHPRYIAPDGMSAIAKFLATGLDIRLNRRAQSVTVAEQTWQIELEVTNANQVVPEQEPLITKAMVVAIPAPQALTLLESLGDILSVKFLERLRSIEYDPCLSVIAGYPPDRQQDLSKRTLDWQAVDTPHDSILSWVGLDSSKRAIAPQPVFVLQSYTEFAQQYLDATDLEPAAYQMLNRAAALIPWLDSPEWFQIHRWRYAFPRWAWQENYLAADTIAPLVCCGDWCGGDRIASALNSGTAAMYLVKQSL